MSPPMTRSRSLRRLQEPSSIPSDLAPLVTWNVVNRNIASVSSVSAPDATAGPADEGPTRLRPSFAEYVPDLLPSSTSTSLVQVPQSPPSPMQQDSSSSASLIEAMHTVPNSVNISKAARIRHPRCCPICFDDLEGYVIQLKCQHVLCGICEHNMFKIYNQSRETHFAYVRHPDAQIDFQDPRAHLPSLPRCPICRHAMEKPYLRIWKSYKNEYKKLERPPNASKRHLRRIAEKKARNKKRNMRKNKNGSAIANQNS